MDDRDEVHPRCVNIELRHDGEVRAREIPEPYAGSSLYYVSRTDDGPIMSGMASPHELPGATRYEERRLYRQDIVVRTSTGDTILLTVWVP